MISIRENNSILVLETSHLVDMKIPARYSDVSLSGIPPGKPAEDVFNYVKNMKNNLESGRGLLFSGAAFTGKTSAAVSVLKEAKSRFSFLPYGPRMFSMHQFWRNVKSADFSQYRLCGLLLLDDLGVEVTKEAGKSIVESLLRERYEDRSPTIVTTNLSKKQIQEIYGDSVCARFNSAFDFIGFPPSNRDVLKGGK